MSSIFRKANVEEVIRYEHENGEDWLELRSDLSKKEVAKLMRAAPTQQKDDSPDIEGGLNFMREFFAITAVAWTGGDKKPSVQDYDDLSYEIAQWVDTELGKHFQATIGSKAEDDEKKQST